MTALLPCIFNLLFIAIVSHYYPQILDTPSETSIIKDNYDFIIVGAGAAGCVLANRLSEQFKWKIALLEAGGDETPSSQTPAMYESLFKSPIDWNFSTVPQKAACLGDDGVCQYPQGYVMGGSSSLSGLVYTRGNKHDYDAWEKLGLQGWGYKDVQSYFLKSENIKIKDLSSSPFHNQGGPLTVDYNKYQLPLEEDFIAAWEELGVSHKDYNGEVQAAVGKTQMTIDGARRMSASSAFLRPIKKRKNLAIIRSAMVLKIIIDRETMTATGVEYEHNGDVRKMYAKNEVILCAGAINTPKILMLSGLGPKAILSKLSIPCVGDYPVGEGLQDHVVVSFPFKIKGCSKTIPPSHRNSLEAILDFAIHKSGPLSTSGLQATAFLSVTDEICVDPPEVQILMKTSSPIDLPGPESIVTFMVLALRPCSTGCVKLKSSKPEDPPIIDPQFFSDPKDILLTIGGLKKTLHMMASKTMAKYEPEVYWQGIPDCCDLWADEDKLLECVVRFNSSSLYNPVGTVKMGKDSDCKALLDSKLKFKNVQHLRVVDASVIPKMVSSNTLAPVIMIAEKAADLIKQES